MNYLYTAKLNRDYVTGLPFGVWNLMSSMQTKRDQDKRRSTHEVKMIGIIFIHAN